MTMTWKQVAPIIEMGLTQGTAEGKRLAREELGNMANAADHAVEMQRELELALDDHPMTMAQFKLFAIRARLQGNWDNPALMAYGPLSADTQADIMHILQMEPETEAFNVARNRLEDTIAS